MDSNARPDHVHCLLSLPPALAVAEGLRLIKSNSSLWIHQTWHGAAFAWQVGYGAFSVSQSNVPAVVKYIRDQEQHHRTISLQEEFLAFLKSMGSLTRGGICGGSLCRHCRGCACGDALSPTAHAVR